MLKIKTQRNIELETGAVVARSKCSKGDTHEEDEQRRIEGLQAAPADEQQGAGEAPAPLPDYAGGNPECPAHWPEFLRALTPYIGRAMMDNLMADCGSWEVWLDFLTVSDGMRLHIKEIVQEGSVSRWVFYTPRKRKRNYRTVRSLLWRIHSGTEVIEFDLYGTPMTPVKIEAIGPRIIVWVSK